MNQLVRAMQSVAAPNGDDRTTDRVTILAVDPDTARLEVAVDDDSMLIPALGYIDDYEPGDTVLIIRDSTGPIALGPLGKSRTITELPATGTVTAIGASEITLSTSIGTVVAGSIVSAVLAVSDKVLIHWDGDGKAWAVGEVGVSATAPAAPGTPSLKRTDSSVTASISAVSTATSYRWRWSYNGGSTWKYKTTTTTSASFGIGQGQTITVGVQALNTGGASSYSTSATETYPQSSTPSETAYETQTVTIQPSDSGTYRSSVGRWNDWNRGRWDFPRTIYQGNAYGSGDMTGLAVFGSRITNLGAVEITKAVLRVERNSWAGPSSVACQVQGATNGSIPSGAPSLTGSTATTAAMPKGASRTVDLPESMREALRTGAIRGLATVGSGDAGFYGSGGSFSLTITFRRRA